MLTPQKIIDAAASLVHQRRLKALGWRKKGKDWVLAAGEGRRWPRVIGIQLNRYNTAEEASFTVNLGISIPEIRSVIGFPVVEAGRLKEYDCELRQRLAMLIHDRDHWWKVTTGDDPERVATELLAGLESHGFPWFENFADYQDVARADRNSRGNGMLGMVALQMGGQPEEAARVLIELLGNSNPMALPRIRQVAKACGIALSPGES